MKKALLIITQLWFISSLFGQELPNSEIWKGEIETRLGAIEITIELKLNEGIWTGTLASSSGLPKTLIQNVVYQDTHFSFSLPSLSVKFEGQIVNKSIEGTWKEGSVSVELKLFRQSDFVSKATLPLRKQTPVKPFEYQSVEVAIQNLTDGLTLSGTLTLPNGNGPFPAAILLSVAGANDRDQTHSMGHKPFMVLADFLTKNGIAVLRYDDRGVGKSQGSIYESDFTDFKNDALAAFELLKERPDISEIGFIGNSEGSLIGSMASIEEKRVAFIIMLGGVGLTLEELTKDRIIRMNAKLGLTENQLKEILDYMVKVYGILLIESDNKIARQKLNELQAKNTFDNEDFNTQAFSIPKDKQKRVDFFLSPWYRAQISYNPNDILSNINCPVLAITGSIDPYQRADINFPAIQSALILGGNSDYTLMKVPAINHLMQTGQTGLSSEYGLIEESFSPLIMSLIKTWIQERFIKNYSY
jgi:uncharacterized protein